MISPVLVKIWVVDLQMDSQQGFSTADGGDHQRRWRCVLAVRLAGKGLNGTSSIDFRYEENRRGGGQGEAHHGILVEKGAVQQVGDY